MVNLAPDSSHASTLQLWRQRMVEQFEREGRGPDFVQNGKLMQRTKVLTLACDMTPCCTIAGMLSASVPTDGICLVQGLTYGPNYPKGPPVLVGDPVVTGPNGAPADTWTYDSNAQRLRLNASESINGTCLEAKQDG